jgi:hypothetical protein
MRKGFGLIQVIFFMVILSGILSITMKYANISSKQTADLFVKEQAELFLRSATEMALLGISGHDKTIAGNECLHDIKVISDDQRFIADINISNYFLINSETCDLKTVIQTEESNGMIMMNIVVETNNTHPKNSTPIRITRRMLQKP